MNDFFDNLEENALKQFRDELSEFKEFASNDRNCGEASDAILSLRQLPQFKRWNALAVLDEMSHAGSTLRDFREAVNPREFLRVPKTLSESLSYVRWCIEDDGYLDIIRVEIEDDVNELIPSIKSHRVEFRYHLVDDEYADFEALTKNLYAKGRSTHSFFNPKIKSVSRAWFGSMDKFTEFIRILADQDNYDEYDIPKSDEIEKLLTFQPISGQANESK